GGAGGGGGAQPRALPPRAERLAGPPADVVEHLVPRDALPPPAPARPDAAQRIADPLGIGHLIERRWPLGAVAPAAPRVRRVALELLDRERLAIDVGQEPAGRLAVEAHRWDQRGTPLDLLRPGDRLVLLPVVPALDGRVALEASLGRGKLPGNRVKRRGGTFRHGCPSSVERIARPSPTSPPRARDLRAQGRRRACSARSN